MDVVRIKLHQNQANYRKGETQGVRLTYPLPPLSTVIGALHVACGYKEYHPMDISVQGRYESIQQKVYRDQWFLDSLDKQRGTLVKMANGDLLDSGYEVVASSYEARGFDYYTGELIKVHRKDLLEEYRGLVDAVKGKDGGKEGVVNTKRALACFKTLITAPKKIELLNNIDLILHIKSDAATLQDILENIGNLTSIGRSEDFINVQDIRVVKLTQSAEKGFKSEFSAYVDYRDIRNNAILGSGATNSNLIGTKYAIKKDYTIQDKKRVFNLKSVVYLSEHSLRQTNDRLWLDDNDGNFIVSLL